MITKQRIKWAAILTGSLAALLYLRGCWQDFTRPVEPVIPSIKPLPPEDQLRVWVGDGRILVQEKQKVTSRALPSGTFASVTIKKDGRVDLRVKKVGFLFEPGIGVMASDKLRLTLDSRWGFLGRFGCVTGLAVGPYKPGVIGYIGISYGLDQLRLSNTSLVVTYTTQRQLGVGIRVRL